MSQSQRRFVTFRISHYCEKARWALDWHGIAYEEINWPPGVHIILAKSCGAKETSLPILLDGRTVIQGSGAIIDWADRQTREPARRLTVTDAREIEQRADSVIGVHVRRLAYAELLPRFPELAKPALFGKASGSHRLIGNVMWPLSWLVMMRMHDITPDAAAESRSILGIGARLDRQHTRRQPSLSLRRPFQPSRHHRCQPIGLLCATPRDADLL